MMATHGVEGKRVFITGGARGLGAGYAKHLASKGARVVIADINEAGVQSMAETIAKNGGDVKALHVDVTSEESVASAIDAAKLHYDEIDVLLNNAGGAFTFQSAAEVSLEDWNRTIALCLTGTWLCARAVIPGMKSAGYGRIINIVSTTIERGMPAMMAPYIASKGGVAALTRVLARELGEFGITVNAISPGTFIADHGEELLESAQQIMTEQCIPRLGVPEDLVGAAEFFASDASSYITGQILNVDGGWTMR
ncbi:SDR family oxidoreductase [Altericroceibacterium spongiae]|uniref:SDR family oxidoreductase n=1 Tax=Altericroceibacterium spongiae TaxID=2320269 RepID=A0A420EQW5_9SPHN|nr:SDR family NAD(P)-dependent oxidoreductase [Altericroceibacterium spongiae]RKF23067.1 SDR family oxidoreductase [Altericroceibacterium spongiae]